MHMPNELLSPSVAGVLFVAAATAVGLAARRGPHEQRGDAVPLMGVMGAFVFAAQMINFPLPLLAGASGHLGGAALLAILLGPRSAVLIMTAVLSVQCLIFQDGGLLALGANILNIAVVPSCLAYAVYRLFVGESRHVGSRVYAGSFLAALLGVCAGAAMVPIECAAAGVIELPTGAFLGAMLSVHAVIGCVEGVITFAVIACLCRTRPDWLRLTAAWRPASRWAVLASLAAAAFVLAGAVSLLASSLPDGLEWASAKRPDQSVLDGSVAAARATAAELDRWQERTAPLPDYGANLSASWGKSLAGVAGTSLVIGVVCLLGALRRRAARASPARTAAE